jgi:isoleucyl-tRNA synthetase
MVEAARRLVSLGRAARNKVKIRTRQPLAEVLAVTRNRSLPRQEEILEHVREELNVKGVRFVSDPGAYVRYEVKPRFDRLGPKYGKEVQAIARAVTQMDPLGVLKALDAQGGVSVQIGEEPGSDLVVLTLDEVEVRMHTEAGYAAEGMAGEFAILDTQVSPELEREGRARELVHHIQQLRKDEGLELADRIVLFVEGEGLDELVSEHSEYLLRETLGVDLRREVPPTLTPREVRLDGAAARIALQRANG